MQKEERALFAGGCFWCTQQAFDGVNGVISAVSGYTGGDKANPTYEEVCSGRTGHVEALEVIFNSSIISYQELLNIYWKSIDPTSEQGQFCDIGPQYRPVIFYMNEMQKELAEASKQDLIRTKKIPVLVAILPAKTFYPAEAYHQQYYKKNPARYQSYYDHSGRRAK